MDILLDVLNFRRISMLITDADLRDLMLNLGGRLDGNEIWEDVIDKRSDLVSYKAKFCRPKVCHYNRFSIDIFFISPSALGLG